MARSLQEVKESVKRFNECLSRQLPVKKVLLYGSYAKGCPRADSDVDVAVFLDYPDHARRLEIAAKLFHFAADIDIEIEPKCFFWDEYTNYDKASILAEIIRTAIEV
ncbi:MAG: nucleotidyltransferase domain-containing protein [Planctomycetes bacterium]|nr:nucleotidyltransferase domain-containing protein [Planctomycetota bacterium]